MADISNRLGATDRVELWEFSDGVRRIGEATGSVGVRDLVGHVSPVQGGTEIGGAIAACTRGREAADILIVTDGKSYALDVHAAARSGARFTVVLVGEDALAANVGHLAALTGGQVFLSSGPDLPALMEMAVASMRAPRTTAARVEPGRLPEFAGTCAGGMRVGARWLRGATEAPAPTEHARVVGAYAAWLALPAMEESDAAALAEAEGIVSHLTSLVLVDEAAEAQDAIPAQRKVALSTPRVMADIGWVACAPAPAAARVAAAAVPSGSASLRSLFRTAVGLSGLLQREPSASASSARIAPTEEMGLDLPTFVRRQSGSSGHRDHEPPARRAPPTQPRRGDQEAAPPQPPRPKRPPRAAGQVDLSVARARIPWGAEPERLRAGDLGGLPADVVAVLLRAAEVEDVKHLAVALGIPPVVVVLALLARVQAGWDNAARRFFQALLGPADPDAIEACMRELGL
ncbi:MAG TPA: hypothetical protein VGN83_21000 [Falsiroseomonas sp.]|jgi:hypothetical protein|nr:hypothetical protein [Falsiroseomonas sp.]